MINKEILSYELGVLMAKSINHTFLDDSIEAILNSMSSNDDIDIDRMASGIRNELSDTETEDIEKTVINLITKFEVGGHVKIDLKEDTINDLKSNFKEYRLEDGIIVYMDSKSETYLYINKQEEILYRIYGKSEFLINSLEKVAEDFDQENNSILDEVIDILEL